MPAQRFHSASIDVMYLPPLDVLAERVVNDPSHRKRPLGGPLKRIFDVVAASVLLIVMAPLLVLLAYLVALGSPGPMMFRHRRVGLGGIEFECLKFRTMQVDAEQKLTAFLAANPEAAEEWARDRKLRKDPRINMIGKFLRKTSLDELPQLLNVLRGEMSLVGPRPVVREELKMYGERSAFYLAARPGITGLWQTSGRNATTYERRTQLDAHYVASWTFLGDIVLLVKTVPELAGWARAF